MGQTLLRQERSRATRIAIMSAAERLWAATEFDSVSVEQVCIEAGISKGLFYFYFPKKEHLLVMLLFARIRPRGDEMRALLESQATTLELCQSVAALIEKRVKKMKKHLVRRAIEESFQQYAEIGKLEGGNRSLRWYFGPIFERGLARGDVHESWDLEILITMLGWAVLQGILFWSRKLLADSELADDLKMRAELVVNGGATQSRAKRKRNSKLQLEN
jgi:AcrR family transcriptional regulator